MPERNSPSHEIFANVAEDHSHAEKVSLSRRMFLNNGTAIVALSACSYGILTLLRDVKSASPEKLQAAQDAYQRDLIELESLGLFSSEDSIANPIRRDQLNKTLGTTMWHLRQMFEQTSALLLKSDISSHDKNRVMVTENLWSELDQNSSADFSFYPSIVSERLNKVGKYPSEKSTFEEKINHLMHMVEAKRILLVLHKQTEID